MSLRKGISSLDAEDFLRMPGVPAREVRHHMAKVHGADPAATARHTMRIGSVTIGSTTKVLAKRM